MSDVRVAPARDEDLSDLATLLSAARPLDPPYSPDALRALGRADPLALLLAARIDGRVAGGALATGGGEWKQPDGAFMVPALLVAESHRGRGAGTAMADRIEAHAFGAGARRVVTSVRGDAEPGLRFAAARGYREFHREAWSRLDLIAWDARRFADADATADADVTVLALRDVLALEPQTRRDLVARIMAAQRELLADLPTSEVRFPERGVEEYERRMLRTFDVDGSVVALRGGDVAAIVLAFRSGTNATILVAGEVARGRGRKLIAPLKVRAIDALRRAGATAVASIFDRDNAVTRQLNRSLGFVRQPAHIRLELRR